MSGLSNKSYTNISGVENIFTVIAHETGHNVNIGHGDVMQKREWDALQYYRRESN